MFRLALALGRTVAELTQSLSSSELTEWMAFYRLEPFGEERADYRNGLVCSLLANKDRNPKKTPKPYQPKDFMPFTENKKTTAKQLKAQLSHMVKNGR